MNNLAEKCFVNTKGSDQFVGIKINKDCVSVHFPLGYELAEEERLLRSEVKDLLNILYDFKDSCITGETNNHLLIETPKQFPFYSYIRVLNYFINNGAKYYVETEKKFSTQKNGDISWDRTIKRKKPLIVKRGKIYSFAYNNFIIKQNTVNTNNIITQINKFCVYQSYVHIGQLFFSLTIPKYKLEISIKEAKDILKKKLNNTFNDNHRNLFRDMLNIINFCERNENISSYVFGTYHFEHIWEKLIDAVYGITNKEKFFPKARWELKKPIKKILSPLMPDTIMIIENTLCIIDAKYYKFGITSDPNDLPNTSSINKQITYGEYIYNLGLFDKIYNIFLMPYNKSRNNFSLDQEIGEIGIAKGNWRKNEYEYEEIHGIVIDTKYLMKMYKNHKISDQKKLLELIIND